MTNKSALFFACDGEDVVDFAEELGRKVVVNTRGPLTLDIAAQSTILRRIVIDQYSGIATSKVWVVLDRADLETIATMVDDEDFTRVWQHINSKVLKYTAEVDDRIAEAITIGAFPAPPLETVLVIGSGGREHAIVHSLRKSPLLKCIYVSPGNYGTAHECDTEQIGDENRPECVCVNIRAMSTAEVVEFAVQRGVSMVIVGPEKPLVDGLADALREKGIACFGPSRRASQIEASKAWSKEFMRRHNLPTAAFRTFSSSSTATAATADAAAEADADAAQAYIESVQHRVVVKASGLADGKGVLLPQSTSEAVAAARSMLVEGAFGAAGREIVVEQFLQGEEVSVLAFCDGTTAVGMPAAQDHKRALDGDEGLNTGGMGAYAPTPLITPGEYAACMQIIQDTVTAMAAEGVPFIGVLYAGFILTPDCGPMLLEYNCRLGDPEAQVLLPLLESDLCDICKKCAAGTLQRSDVVWSKQKVACTVVCAAPGYPEPGYPRGAVISGLDQVSQLGLGDKVKVYHAGTTGSSTTPTTGVPAVIPSVSAPGGCPYGFGPPKVAEGTPASNIKTSSGTSSGGCPYGFGGAGSDESRPAPPLARALTVEKTGGCPFGHGGSGGGGSGGGGAAPSPTPPAASTTGCPMGYSSAATATTVAATSHASNMVTTLSISSSADSSGGAGGCPMGFGSAAQGTSSSSPVSVGVCDNDEEKVVTNGGRVLAVTGTGATLKEAVDNAYTGVRSVFFEGMHYRRDIAKRGLERSLKIGVLGSTRGSSLQPVIDVIQQGSLNAAIALVVSNKAGAGILERARQHNLPALHLGAANKTREQYDAELCAALDAAGVDLVLLIGYMRIVSPVFTKHFQGRCVNVHPSLLPEFAGGMDLDVHAAVLAAKRPISGCTVHIVTDEVDGGPILVQKQCEVNYPGETVESLKAKVQQLEGQAFIEVIQMFIRGEVETRTETAEVTQTANAAPTPKPACPYSKPTSSSSALASSKPAAEPEKKKAALSYRAAGVDIDAGEALVEAIKPFCKATLRSGCASAELGGFGGLFDLAASGYAAADTVLVSGTDGVGTKLKIAQVVNKHDTIGIDLVAMCVNDILVCGAEPLFFLDYYATGALNVAEAALVVKGIAEGCKQAGCALIGGETAEMSGMYRSGEYDLAGFSVGAVRKCDLMPRLDAIRDCDVLIAVRSSGVHSNGFSLVRKCVEQSGLQWTDPPPFESPHATLGEALLQPTSIYVQELLPLARRRFIKAMAHITGGGLTDNIPRVLPPHLRAVLNAASPDWPLPPVFRWLQDVAQLSQEELVRTFNCGIGMVLVVDRVAVPAVMHELHGSPNRPFIVGAVRTRPVVPAGEASPQVVVVGTLA